MYTFRATACSITGIAQFGAERHATVVSELQVHESREWSCVVFGSPDQFDGVVFGEPWHSGTCDGALPPSFGVRGPGECCVSVPVTTVYSFKQYAT